MTNRKRKEMARRIRVRGIRRNPPDIRKLGQAIIALAQAQAEKEAEAEHRRAAFKARREGGSRSSTAKGSQ